jgi:hypothetical protein
VFLLVDLGAELGPTLVAAGPANAMIHPAGVRTAHPGRAQGERHGGSQTVEVKVVADEKIQREVLPIPDREYPGVIAYDARTRRPSSHRSGR